MHELFAITVFRLGMKLLVIWPVKTVSYWIHLPNSTFEYFTLQGPAAALFIVLLMVIGT